MVGTNNINISTTNSGVPVNGIVAQIDSVSTIKITGSGSLNISTTSGWAGGCYDIYNSSGVGANTVEFYDTVKLDLTSPNFCVGSLGKIVFSMDAGGYVHSTSTGAPAIDPYSVISLQHNNTISSPTGGKLGADSKKVLNSDDSDAFEVKIIGGTLTQEPVEYTIIEGAKQEVDLAKASSAVFRSDAEFDDFDSVKVDDVTLTENTDYTAAEGSTIVTLTKSFLNTLKAGTHTLVIVSDDGEAETTFTIKAAPTPTPVVDEDEKVAKTGDNNAIGVFVAMGAISAVAFVSLKKKEQN